MNINTVNVLNRKHDSALNQHFLKTKSCDGSDFRSLRKILPNYVSHKNITTKPENQGPFNMCTAYTITTIAESLAWKLTGIYREFSKDEIFNIYLDMVNSMNENKERQGEIWTNPNYTRDCYTNAEKRKTLRGTNGQWIKIDNTKYDQGEYYDDETQGLILGDGAKDYMEFSSIWTAIYKYNDADRRKNHYPDDFSTLCFILHNYLKNNVFRYFSDKEEPKYSDNVPPQRLKEFMFCNGGYPSRSSIPGHACANYYYNHKYFVLNSSWQTQSVYEIKQPYNQTEPYYTKGSILNTGDTYDKYNRINAIELFNRKMEQTETCHLMISGSERGQIIGSSANERFKKGELVQLQAIPNSGCLFVKWSDGDTSNPRTILMDEDKKISAIFA